MYRTYAVSRHQKEPLLRFILESLEMCGCKIQRFSDSGIAPFRVTFDAPDGERIGIVTYAFYANSKVTRNRPTDEHRFQVKYGMKDDHLHELWQDPYELYTTLFLGINPDMGFFVGADPVAHSPTRFFISIEFKESNVQDTLRSGWASWERQKRGRDGYDDPVEVLVGGRPEHFLRYVRFERAAKGFDAGHRDLLAEKLGTLHSMSVQSKAIAAATARQAQDPTHAISAEFRLAPHEILDLIHSAPRLKMAVRGWVAEAHLRRQLEEMPDITECSALEEDGKPDFRIRFRHSDPLHIECKNVLRRGYADRVPRVDFQRTRAAKSDPCSRYYRVDDFQVIAACLHPRTERWEFSFALTSDLEPHPKCPGRLDNRLLIDERWSSDLAPVLERAIRLAAD